MKIIKRFLVLIVTCIFLLNNHVAIKATEYKTLGAGEVLLNDTYNAQLTNTTPTGYIFSRNDNISHISYSNGNKYIYSAYDKANSTSNKMYFDKNLDEICTGKLVMEYKVKIVDSDAQFSFLRLRSAENSWKFTTDFNSDKTINVYGRSVGVYELNNWYQVVSFIDMDEMTIKTQITGFRVNVNISDTIYLTSIKAIRFNFEFLGDGAACHFDDFRIYGGSERLDLFPQEVYNRDFTAISQNIIDSRLDKSLVMYSGIEKCMKFGSKTNMTAPLIFDDSVSYAPGDILKESFGAHPGTIVKNNVDYADLKKYAVQNRLNYFEDSRGVVIISDASQSFELPEDKSLITKIISTVIYDRPSAQFLMENGKNAMHPYIGVNEEKIINLKNLRVSDSKIAEYINQVISTADIYERSNITGYNDAEMHVVSSRIRNKIGALGMAYLITGDEKYADKAWQQIDKVCDFPDWFVSNGLAQCELLQAMGMAFDWFYDYMDKVSGGKEKVIKAIKEKGLIPLEEIYDCTAFGYDTWATRITNWNAVCNGGAGVLALSVINEDSLKSLASKCLEMTLKSSELYLEQYAPDGAWYEGLTYGSYALRQFAPFVVSLENVYGKDYGISLTPALSESADFLVYTTGPGGIFNFHDSPSSIARSDSDIYFIASEYNKPYLTAFNDKFKEILNNNATYQDLFYYEKTDEVAELDCYDKLYGGTGISVFKFDNSETSSFIAAHAGAVYGAHSEFDAGTFVLDALGERWAEDLGPDNYNLSDYNTIRQDFPFYRRRAEGHNTLVINPDKSAGQKVGSDTVIDRFENSYTEGITVLDLTSAYEYSGAKSVKRGIRVDKEKSVFLIQDEIECENESEIYWFMHTKAEVNINPNNPQTAILKKGKKELEVTLLSPKNASFSVMDAVPLSTSPEGKGQNANEGIRKLFVNLKDTKKSEIAVLIRPSGTESYYQKLSEISSWQLKREGKYTRLTQDEKYIRARGYVDNFVKECETMMVLAAYGDENKISDIKVSRNRFPKGSHVNLLKIPQNINKTKAKFFVMDMKTFDTVCEEIDNGGGL